MHSGLAVVEVGVNTVCRMGLLCLLGCVLSDKAVADVLNDLRLFMTPEARAGTLERNVSVETEAVDVAPPVVSSGDRGHAVVRGSGGEQRIIDGVPWVLVQ